MFRRWSRKPATTRRPARLPAGALPTVFDETAFDLKVHPRPVLNVDEVAAIEGGLDLLAAVLTVTNDHEGRWVA